MAEALEKFDPSKLMDGVKDRIKATFVSLIPEDHWEQMIKTQIDHFFNYQKTGGGYHASEKLPTEFAEICNTELTIEAKKRIAKYLSGPEFQTQWASHGAPAISTAVEKTIIENSGAVLANMIGGLSSQLLQDMANKARQGY